MNDDEVITAVREQRDKVYSHTPVDQIISRGRAVRARRRVPRVAAALGAAAAVAVAVSVALPASHPASQSRHPASHPLVARLAAWTVAKQANGDSKITIRELSDPSGLQSTLRADGVPANVSSSTQFDPSCQPYPQTQALFTSIYHAQKGAGSGDTVLVIHPAALPSGAGIEIGASVDGRAGDRDLHQVAGNQTVHQPVHQVAPRAGNTVLRVGLVYASQQCTGS
jgi:hypothetical protein